MTDPSSPLPFTPSDFVLNSQIELIISRWSPSKVTIRDPLEHQIFKLGIAIGMNEAYSSLLHNKPSLNLMPPTAGDVLDNNAY